MMKKILSGLMAGLVGLFGVGCQNQQSNEPTVTTDNPTESIETSVSDHGEGTSRQEESVETSVSDRSKSSSGQEASAATGSETISKNNTTEAIHADTPDSEGDDDLDQVTSQAETVPAPETAVQSDEQTYDEFGNEEL